MAKAIKTIKEVKKAKLKTIPQLLKVTQDVFNVYIRKRDNGLPCISCGNMNTLQAGHFVPVFNSSALRFHEWNVNGECCRCNAFDEFHVINYRKNLIDKIGPDAVKWLIDNQRGKRAWTREELHLLIELYKA